MKQRDTAGRGKVLKELELQLQGSAVALEASKKGFGGAVMAVRDAEKAVER